MDAEQAASEQLLDDAVLGFQPGRHTGEINFIISRLVAHANGTGFAFIVANMDVTRPSTRQTYQQNPGSDDDICGATRGATPRGRAQQRTPSVAIPHDDRNGNGG